MEDIEELKKASKHLAYELEMLNAIVHELRKDWSAQNVLKNALLESFAIHSRVLDEFFFTTKANKPDDFLAIHFDPKWGETPKRTKMLIKARKRVGKEVAHLTYSRRWELIPEKEWHIQEIAKDLLDNASKFFQYVEESRLSDEAIEVRNKLPEWIVKVSHRFDVSQITTTSTSSYVSSYSTFTLPPLKSDNRSEDDGN